MKDNLSRKACEVALVVHSFMRVTTSARTQVSTQPNVDVARFK